MLFHGTASFFSNLSLLIGNSEAVFGRLQAMHPKRVKAEVAGARNRGDAGNGSLFTKDPFRTSSAIRPHRTKPSSSSASIPGSFTRHDQGEEDGTSSERQVPLILKHVGVHGKRSAPPLVICDPNHDAGDYTGSTPSSRRTCAPDLECVPLPHEATLGACVSQNKPADTGALSSYSKNTERTLQQFDDTTIAQALFDSYCSPSGDRYGYCSNCPDDLLSFDPPTTVLTLLCDGPCTEPFGVAFRGTSASAIGDHYFIGSSQDVCSPLQRQFVDLCHPLGFQAQMEGSPCDCPNPYTNVETGSTQVVCSLADCIERVHAFVAGEYSVSSRQVCDSVLDMCADSSNNCDCSKVSFIPGGSGTVVCEKFGCREVNYTVVDGFTIGGVKSKSHGNPCEKTLEYVCDYNYDCDCNAIDEVTGTGTGTCSGLCSNTEFSFDSGTLTSYEKLFCAYTAYGEFCYTEFADSYQCPTINGQPCSCQPIQCASDEISGASHQFSFECSNGFSADTCTPDFFFTRVYCPDSISNLCEDSVDAAACDCDSLERDNMGAISAPLNGQVKCNDFLPAAGCEVNRTITFNGDKTFALEECADNPVPGFNKICTTLPYKVDDSCPVSADGNQCSGCSSTSCNVVFGLFPGFSFECESSDGQQLYSSSTCELGCGSGSVTPATVAPVMPVATTKAPTSAPVATTASPNSLSSTTNVAIGVVVSLLTGFALASL